MKISMILLALLISLPISAFSSIEKTLANCAAIKGDLQRLDCYDKVSKDKKLTPQKSIREDIKDSGKWSIQEKTNPIDDSKTIYIYLEADSGIGRYGDKVFFVARCQSNKTDVYINWESYLGREVTVLTRIGDSQARTEEWNISSDSKASFRRKPIVFLKDMLNADKLVAQTTPYNENPITAIFNTSGLKNAIKPLRKECGW